MEESNPTPSPASARFAIYAEIHLTVAVVRKLGVQTRVIPVCGESRESIERMRDCIVLGYGRRGESAVEHSRIVYPESFNGN